MQLTLLTRADCELCEHMHAEISALSATTPLPTITLRDVDDDLELQRRYGLKVPVLLLDGAVICHGRLDAAELRRVLAKR